jgi:xylulokinase
MMSSEKLVMGFDVGTQSTKAVLYDVVAKEIVAVGSSPHDIIQKEDGTSEQQPDWWDAAVKNSVAQLPADKVQAVRAIGVSGQQHGFVPLGENGKVLYNAKLWNDTSTTKECAEIEARFGGKQKMVEQVGNPMLPGYTAPKIAWLKNNRPEVYAQLATILLPHDYINYRLTGTLAMEYGDASGTGLLNIRTRQWDTAMLKALDPNRDLSSCLPKLIAAPILGHVSESAAAEFGIPAGIPVCSGGGDNMMAAIGTGCVKSGVVSMSMGTSGTVFAFSEHPVIDSKGEVAAFCDSTNGWLPLVCTMNCTVATELVRNMLQISVKELDAAAEKVSPGSDGLLTLPFFTGERTPNLPNARGSLIGLSPLNFTTGHLARSAMEAALFGLRYGLDAIRRNGVEPTTVHLTGGGAKSPLWRQMAADILGCTVCVPEIAEAAAFGAALKALWVLEDETGKSSIASITEAHVKLKDETISPNKDVQQVYNTVYENYLKAVNTVSPLFD